MDSNGASVAGGGPGASACSAITASPGGHTQLTWGAHDIPRTNGSGNPMDIQQILQQQQQVLLIFFKMTARIKWSYLKFRPISCL